MRTGLKSTVTLPFAKRFNVKPISNDEFFATSADTGNGEPRGKDRDTARGYSYKND